LSELWRPEQLVTALRSRDLANFCVDSKPKLGGVVCVLLVDGTTANLNPIRSAGSIRGLIRGNKGTLCAGEVGGCHEKLFEVEADVGIAWRIREFVWAEVVTLIDSPEWQRIEYIDWLGRRQQRPSSGKLTDSLALDIGFREVRSFLGWGKRWLLSSSNEAAGVQPRGNPACLTLAIFLSNAVTSNYTARISTLRNSAIPNAVIS